MRDWKKWNPLCDQIGAALGYVISDDPNNCRPWRKDGKAFGPTCFDEDLQSAINAVKHLGYAVKLTVWENGKIDAYINKDGDALGRAHDQETEAQAVTQALCAALEAKR